MTKEQTAEYVRQQIEALETTIARMVAQEVPPGPGIPSPAMMARGVIVNQLMHRACQESGPAGMELIEGMYRDFCGLDEQGAAS